jgi:hypothetical protein
VGDPGTTLSLPVAWRATLLPPPPARAVIVHPACPVRVWVQFQCGSCGRDFDADPNRVPTFTTRLGKWAMCAACWDRRNRLRAAIGEPPQGRPPCYPGDYPPPGA